MEDVTLPPHVVSLIHHVELNKAGWWEKAIQRLIVGAIWLAGDNPTPEEIRAVLQQNFRVRFDLAKIEAQLDILCAGEELIRLSAGRYKISEGALKQLESEVEQAEATERRAKAAFTAKLAEHCPSLDGDETWPTFAERFLLRLVRDLGARVYRLITGGTPTPYLPELDAFLWLYRPELHPGLRATATSFLDPGDPDVRAYVLRALNAHFFVEAGNLSDDTIQALAQWAAERPRFQILLDTNCLFSILGLHENPSNEAVLSLVKLIGSLGEKVDVELCVLPATVSEARRVLAGAEGSLGDLRLTPNVAAAALDVGLTGIGRKYVEECQRADTPLTVEAYFGPYLTDLATVIETKGIAVLKEKTDGYGTRQDVVDDILDQRTFEAQKFGPRAKEYDQLRHDVVLWHFVTDLRPELVESPLDAVYWVVTLDYRFMGFDAFKRRALRSNVPVCIHPTTLVQLLQFWVPRTAELEEALLGTMRLPFLFREFDPAAEKVTIRILDALSRFENVGDLPQGTVRNILVNEALRQRIKAEPAVDRQVELVREALIDENQRAEQDLRCLRDKTEQLEAAVAASDRTIDELRAQADEERRQRCDLEARLRKIEEDRLAEENTRCEQEEARAARRQARQEIRGFVWWWCAAPLAAIALVGTGAGSLVSRHANLDYRVSSATFWCAFLLVWLVLADRSGMRLPAVRDWRPFTGLRRLRKWLFGGVAALLVAVLGNVVYYWLWPPKP